MPNSAIWMLVFVLALCTAAACRHDATDPDAAPVLIAHRGASGHLPEHTFDAYDLALEMGADYLEHDLHLTRDGQLIVLHDDALTRTARGPAADCSGLVREKTLAQLRRCDFGAWFWERNPDAALPARPARVATLDEVLTRYAGRTRFYIETKHPGEVQGMEAALLAVLERHQLLPAKRGDRTVIIQSFSPESLRALNAQRPELPLVLLFEAGELPADRERGFAEIAEIASGIGPFRKDVDAELIAAAHRHGLVVHPWTVNHVDEISKLLALGVDGVFTDYPDRFREACCDGGG